MKLINAKPGVRGMRLSGAARLKAGHRNMGGGLTVGALMQRRSVNWGAMLASAMRLLSAAWLLGEQLVFAQATGPASVSSAGSLTGRVEDAQDRPLPGVTVCLCTRSLDVFNGLLPPEHFPVNPSLGRPADQDSFYFATTQPDGRFSFPTQHGKGVLLASTRSGYAIADGTVPSPVVLRLAPWARLEGVVLAGDKPAHEGVTVSGEYDEPSSFGGIELRLHLRAATDEHGRFIFERTFSGMVRLFRRGSPGVGACGRPVRAHLPAGKTTRLVIPVLGPTVAGRVQLPAKLSGRDLYLQPEPLDSQRPLPLLTLPAGFLQLVEADREAWLQHWASSPAARAALQPPVPQSERPRVCFDRNSQPLFRLVDAPPGEHTMSVMVFPRTKDRVDYEHRLAVLAYRLTIPPASELNLDATTDLGELPALPDGLDRAGQPAPDFTLRTLDGREHTLSQFKGKVVLLDFWGTWCGACLSELPRMQALHAAFESNPDFVMLGLSVRDDPAVLSHFVQKNRVGWMQAAMGDSGKAWCVRLYQVEGYPTFYLIGKDGRVIANGHWADDLLPMAASALASKGP